LTGVRKKYITKGDNKMKEKMIFFLAMFLIVGCIPTTAVASVNAQVHECN
jgi:hypothetical protein